MFKDKGQDDNKKKNFTRINEMIRISPILVIHDGKNLGSMSNRDALAYARSVGLDLVEVAANVRPPVCHVIDYGKFKYDKSKSEKQKGAGAKKDKEVAFRYVIEDHDLETKINQIRRFLSEGMPVRLTVKFKNREKAHKDKGFVVLNKVLDILKDEVVIEKPAGFEGGNVTARVNVKKAEKKA